VGGSRKDVRLRLRNAALELYAERGFDRTTAAEVAVLAGVTERTYFRHFPDKREVLFGGEAELEVSLSDAVASAPELAPLAVLRHAFLSLVPQFESDRDLNGRRDRVVSATPDLRERGYTKLAHLSEAVADALERRGTPRPLASLAASCGIEVLSRVRREWLAGSPRSYAALLTDAFADLDLLARGGAAQDVPPSAPRP